MSEKKKTSKKVKYAESRARAYTKNELKLLNWDIRHPSKGGHVLEEQEAKHFDIRLDELLGKKRPDFLVYYENEPTIVIECKSEKKEIQQAIDDAKEYAKKLSKKYFDVKIISGVAGNEQSGVIVRNFYKYKNKWEEINGNNYPLTQLLDVNQFKQVLVNERPTIDLTIPTEAEFYSIAEKINSILHEAKVNKSDRAVYLGSIILAIKEGDIDTSPNVIIKQINANVDSALDSCNRGELKLIFKIKGNSAKLKQKLPLIFHDLDRLNIRALMNTGSDVLGKFFEAFLRYGNDAKELGIVFTPRHIVEFMCKLIDIKTTDVVYDPACGTGGFLIGAFNVMKAQVGNNMRALNKIKLEQLIGCDSDDSGKIPALAVVNMIFRGDGKSNIYNDNCFTFDKFDKPFATKVLMNPPYAQEDEPETMFIDHGLESLKPGCLFSAIFTYAVLCEKRGAQWRNNLLRNHTVIAVITMPPDLFYPTGSHACIMICSAHIPHRGKIWFCRIENDGFKIKRKKRIECEGSQLEKALAMFKMREFNIKQSIEAGFSCYTDLDSDDGLFELVPEAYLESPTIPDEIIQYTLEQLIREFGAFTIKKYPKLKKLIPQRLKIVTGIKELNGIQLLSDIFDISYGQREIHSKEHLQPGGTLVISSQGSDNGCYGFYEINVKYTKPVISVPNTGSIGMAFVQEYPCCIDDNCLVLFPKDNIEISIEEMYFVAALIRLESWRYRYGRQITDKRLGKLTIDFSCFNFTKAKLLKETIENIIMEIQKT